MAAGGLRSTMPSYIIILLEYFFFRFVSISFAISLLSDPVLLPVSAPFPRVRRWEDGSNTAGRALVAVGVKFEFGRIGLVWGVILTYF